MPLLALVMLFSPVLKGQETKAQIEGFVDGYQQPHAGMALVVVKDGRLVTGYTKGFGNVSEEEALTADSRINIGSLARHFTAMAILQMVERNQLSLEDKVAPILGLPDFASEITVYQLLTHTSGLPSYLSLLEPGRTAPVTPQEVVRLVSQHGKTAFEPGLGVSVSHTNYVLLALIIEKKSKRRFEVYMQRNIFRPMGIRDHVVAQRRMSRVRNRTTGYQFRDSAFISDDPGINTQIVGESGVYLSVNDYLKVIEAMRNKTVISSESWDQMFKAGLYKNGNEVYPAHAMIGSIGREKRNLFYQIAGPNNAFTNFMMILPDKDLYVVFMSNQAGLFQLLDKIIYPVVNLYTEDAFIDRIRK
jgi:CubicO group peptidase (beta-lactamase class C family)